MVVDLIEIRDGPNDVRADVSLLIKSLHPAPDSAVAVFDKLGLLRVECIHLVLICCLAIDPLFHLDNASTVVDFVSDVCGLCGYAANLTHEGDLRDVLAVDFEVCVWMWLVGIEGLFHGDGANCILAVGLEIKLLVDDISVPRLNSGPHFLS